MTIKRLLISITLIIFYSSNIVYSATTSYQYDSLHRLTRVERADGTVTTYEYDDLGNRTSKIVTVPSATPVALFSATPQTGPKSLTVQFTDQSTGNPTSWGWDFGDGNTSTERNPKHTYLTAGTFTVSLTVTNAEGADSEIKTDYITVTDGAPPVASFSTSTTSGDIPLLVTFTDHSTGNITSWAWDFGNGDTSTEQSPQYTFESPGNYTVVLTVTGPGGADADYEYITVINSNAPVADFSATPTVGMPPLPVTFTDLSTGEITSWLWDFGDGNTSDLQNPVHEYQNTGNFEVKLTVTGPDGIDEKTEPNFISVSRFEPIPITGLAGSIRTTKAVLNGTVNPNHLSSSAWFEWGETTEYAYSSPLFSIGDGTEDVPITETISGLKHGTTYYYRIAANNSSGTVYGDAGTFTTQIAYCGLTVVFNGEGTVNIEPLGLNFTETSTFDVPEGTSLNLTATQTKDSTFTGWIENGSNNSSVTYNVVMDSAKILYANFLDSAWAIESWSIDNYAFGCINDIGVTSDDKIRIIALKESGNDKTLELLKNDTGSWIRQTIVYNYLGNHTSMTISADNEMRCCYVDKSTSTEKLYSADYLSGAWYPEFLDSSSSIDYPDIAVNSLQYKHICYSGNGAYDLKYSTNVTGSWVTTILDDGDASVGRIGNHSSITVDTANKLHISYLHGFPRTDLKYVTNKSGVWQIYTLDSQGESGYYTSIITDGYGFAHISYVGQGPQYPLSLKYATNRSGTWQVQTIDDENISCSGTAIGLDSNGNVHIAYRANSDLKYATSFNGDWDIYTIDSSDDVGSSPHIILDSKDQIHISYYDNTNQDLKYAFKKAPQQPYIFIDKDQYNFSKVGIGYTSARQVFTIYNSGNQSLDIGLIEMTGTDAGDFSFYHQPCENITLAPFEYCSFSIQLSPISEGDKTAAIEINSNDPDTPVLTVQLSGDGIIDTDGDGIPDDIENASCTNPYDADTDDDGIPDGVEDANQNGIVDAGETDPCNPDTDGDGIQDGTELGYTLDDIGPDTDTDIFQPDLDPASQTDPLEADTDGDGYIDGDEDINHNGRVDIGEGDPVHKNMVLNVNPSFQTVTSSENFTYVTIENTGNSNMPWFAVSLDDWLAISSNNSGINDYTLIVNHTSNPDMVRTGRIIISAPGAVNSPQFLNIRQLGLPTFDETKKYSSEASTFDHFGHSVSVSGSYAIAGAYGEGDFSNGKAYIFEKEGNGDWNEAAAIIGSDTAEADYFGKAVAISGDYAIVGAEWDDNSNGTNAGAAYIFKRETDGTWQQAQKLLPTFGNSFHWFGYSVAISGNYAVVGAPQAEVCAVSSGGAFVYKYNGVTWNEQTMLIQNSCAVGDLFGWSVAIDGEYAIVGAAGKEAVYIFERNENDAWSLVEQLNPDNPALTANFGKAVSIQGDFAVVGAPKDSHLANNAGAVYVFKKDIDGSWVKTDKLIADDWTAEDEFGASVSINGDMITVGAPNNDDLGNNSGAIYLFYNNSGAWEQQNKLRPLDGASDDLYGTSLSISGNHLIVGAPENDDYGDRAGAVYFYDLNRPGNIAPTISAIGDQIIAVNASANAVPFTVNDEEVAAENLTLSGVSSNLQLVPNANISFGGSGADRTVTVTPVANQVGTAEITITVSNGTASSSGSFLLTVSKPTLIGDINDDAKVDLSDAVLALQIVCGIPLAQPINLDADVNGDEKIGIEEAIYAIEKISGIRD
ncbi:MAG: PKD domain-containing protein [Desulfobacteraceae bacterium]|jgi:YD repeat-containing protein|nr:MAG: PKD domain-containing protein [Desulfobacteraceae bacterium]